MMYKKITTTILLFILLVGCMTEHDPETTSIPFRNSVDSSDASLPTEVRGVENISLQDSLVIPLYKIEFIEEQTFQSPNLLSFRKNLRITVSNSGLVSIQRGTDIYVFNSNGQHLATMGGEGRGPGELHPFGQIEMRVKGNRLYTFDSKLKRINIYSLETFKPTETIVFNPGQWRRTGGVTDMYPGGMSMTTPKFHAFRDSMLLMRFDEPAPYSAWSKANTGEIKLHKVYSHYYLMDQQGNIVSEELLQLDYNYMVIGRVAGIPPLPIHSRQLLAVSGTSHIYTAYSKEFLIKIYGPEGSYQRALYFPTDKIPVNLENFTQNFLDSKSVRNRLQSSDLPDHWPVLAGMLVDDRDQIWVPTYTKKEDSIRWYVLSNEGEFIATFDWPTDKYKSPISLGIKAIRDGYLYAFKNDQKDSGEGKFVKYRIQLTPKRSNDQ